MLRKTYFYHRVRPAGTMLCCRALRLEVRPNNDPAGLFAFLKKRPRLIVLAAVLLLAALALRVGIAMHTESVEWPDEIFQTREPAHHLAYGNWVATWEYRAGARSWVFPAVLSVVMRLSGWMAPGSRGYLAGIEIFLSLISLLTVIFGALFAYRCSGWPGAIIAGFGCAFWYELIYYAPRALAEVVAGSLLLPALYLGAYSHRDGKPDRRRLAFGCLLCGLAIALRLQLAPVAMVAIAGFCWGRWKQSLPIVLVCMSVPVLAFGIVDALTWSYPFQSYIENFRFNATGGGNRFGTEPVYWYLVRLVRHLGLLVPLALLGMRRLPLLACAALAVLIPHSLIAHKEFRFLIPMLGMAVILGALGLAEVCGWIANRMSYYRPAVIAAAGCIVLSLLSAQMAWLYPNWHKASAGNILLRDLSADEALCGVGIVGDPWYEEAQYTYLHRNVPIYLISDTSALMKTKQSFNAMLSRASINPGSIGFERMKCVREVCLYERPGGCTPNSQYEINAVLKRMNQ